MSLFVTSLNSGSNGNCYYIGDGETAVLIDAGISCREVEKRMKRLDLSISQIKAIFITHEHSDHILGVPTLSKKYQIPVFITPDTLTHCKGIKEELVRPFSSFETIVVGNLTVTGFPKRHDAVHPHSFVIKNEKVTVGVFTDIGAPCEEVRKYFKSCHAAFLETNYDEKMLMTGRYPIALKRRISGERGHLSNLQAAELFLTDGSASLTHLFLSHLSENNNSPQIVEALFKRCAGETKIILASRHRETAVYHIQGTQQVDLGKRGKIGRPVVRQLTLW